MRFAFIAFAGAVSLAACTAERSAALPFGTDAASCSTCHEAEHEAWSTSPHATSGTSPVFEALLERVGESWGDAAADACVDCHQPGHGGDVGIGCVTCHAATGNTGERDGRLRVDLDAPLAGPRGDGDTPLAGPRGDGDNGAHRIRRTGLLTSPSLCGTCHEVTGPGLLDEPTLSEYRASDIAAASITCATCHMPDGAHSFVGVDPAWGAGVAQQAEARENARALMDDALALRAHLEDDAVVVELENVGAGHSVPTGAAFLRDLWVDVSFGAEETAARVIELGAQPMRGAERVALLTDADSVSHRSLASGETRRVRVPVAADADRVIVTLRLRAIRWDVLRALGLEAREADVPTIDVERVEVR